MNALPRQMTEIMNELADGRLSPVRGTDITVQKVWCSDGYQVGTGLDEQGRRLVFSLSLSTGEGRAKLV